MHKSITIFDIAKLANVGTSTVSRVLNGHPSVSAKTREHVLRAIKEHGYIPNNSARNLSSLSTMSIVVIVNGIGNPLFSRMLAIIQEELQKTQFAMVLQNHTTGIDADIMDTALSLYKEKRPKGMLFLGGYFENSHKKLSLIDLPVVMATTTVHTQCDRSLFSSFTIDDEREAFNVASHIIQCGHNRIGMIGDFEARARGVDKALRRHGLNAAEIRVNSKDAFSYKTGYLAAKRLFEIGSYSCLFCHSDVLAIGAMRAIHEKGLSIPGDISVIGFDGIEAGEYVYPVLTTVKQPADEIARRSVLALLETIETGDNFGHMVLPATFIEGESFRSINE